jgi:hypothetical protein
MVVMLDFFTNETFWDWCFIAWASTPIIGVALHLPQTEYFRASRENENYYFNIILKLK